MKERDHEIRDEQLEKLAREVAAQLEMLIEDLAHFPHDFEAVHARLIAIREYANRGIDLVPTARSLPVSLLATPPNGLNKPVRAPVQ